jgi:hypothetical protein
MGCHAQSAGAKLMELNDKVPYRHWHTVCGKCGKVTLARPCAPRQAIEPVEHNPIVKCQHCEDTRQYLTSECFLAPLSVGHQGDKAAGAVAVVAGLVAAVKLARVESREIQSKSPRVRAAISDSLTIARMVVEAAKGNH